MNKKFEWAAGSVMGRDHREFSWTNNQDAYRVLATEDSLIAVVCDGCGSEGQSEIGAWLGVELVSCELRRLLKLYPKGELLRVVLENNTADFWEAVRLGVINRLVDWLRVMRPNGSPESLINPINQYLMFTIVAALVTPTMSSIAAIGDGVVAINGEVTQLGPFPDNAPPYLVHALLDVTKEYADQLRFQTIASRPTSELQSLLIGTDGVTKIIESESNTVPMNGRLVGPLSQFWKDDRYFANRCELSRQLRLLNEDRLRIDFEQERAVNRPGLLSDDTTLIVIRRKD